MPDTSEPATGRVPPMCHQAMCGDDHDDVIVSIVWRAITSSSDGFRLSEVGAAHSGGYGTKALSGQPKAAIDCDTTMQPGQGGNPADDRCDRR